MKNISAQEVEVMNQNSQKLDSQFRSHLFPLGSKSTKGEEGWSIVVYKKPKPKLVRNSEHPSSSTRKKLEEVQQSKKGKQKTSQLDHT